MSSTSQAREYELIRVNISDLVFDKENPNQMTQKQMAALRQSMQTYGYLTPVIIDQDNKIADGEHRALVYKELGMETIPAFQINLETDSDRLMIRQVMNKLKGEHDSQLDSNELATIFQRNSNDLVKLSTLIDQRKEDLEHLITQYHPDIWFAKPEQSFDYAQALEEIVPTTELGDLYHLGNHRLICGDCTDKRILDRLLLEEEIAQLNTDPPYGVDYASKNEFLNNLDKGNHIQVDIEQDQLENGLHDTFKTIFSNLEQYWADYNTFYIWSSNLNLHQIRMAIEDSVNIHWGDYLVWKKNNHVLGRKDYNAKHEFCIYGWYNHHKFYAETHRTTILEYDKPTVSDLHPTMKPVELIKQLIEDGTQPGDNILDLFTGSGTSLIAAEQSNRNFFGVELDPHYCDVIIKRWEDYTGKKAVKI